MKTTKGKKQVISDKGNYVVISLECFGLQGSNVIIPVNLGALNDFDKPPPGASEGATAPVAAAAADGDNAGAGSQVCSAVEMINSSEYF